MDQRLQRKVDEIVSYAEENGWECAVEATTGTVEGCSDVALVGGAFVVSHPDHLFPKVEFIFTIGFAINEQSGRVVTLRQEECHDAALVITVEDGTHRYWFSKAASHYKQALGDPLSWCGNFDPTVCPKCGTPYEGGDPGGCVNFECSRWRFGTAWDRLVRSEVDQ